MTRRLTRLTRDLLDLLDEPVTPCRSCVRWEADAVRRARLDDATAAAAEKDAWLSWVLREWGSCGRVVLVDGRAVGYVCYAPPAFVPGAEAHPTAPASPDAVLLIALHVAPSHRGGGLGRVLVQAMARDLLQRGGTRAVEAFATTAAAPCLLPADFLASVGFKTHRVHPSTPRMRMDLRSALTWKDEVEAAVERLVGVVRPASPQPSLRETAEPG